MDSTMVRYIDQQDWTDLLFFPGMSVDEVKEFFTMCSNGNF
jgi:hypothetical protein